MTGDPQIELRLSRLDNDRDSIYDLLAAISSVQQDHSRRFDVIDGRLDTIDGRLDTIDGRLDTIDGRLDAVDGRFDAVDRRFDSVEATLAEVVRRLPEPS